MSVSPRVAASCGLLVGLISGCASGSTRDPAANVVPRNQDNGTMVTSEDLDRTPVESIERTLAAKVPGVYISHTADGSIAIRIRYRSYERTLTDDEIGAIHAKVIAMLINKLNVSIR